ncbi:DoxX family protein [Haloferax larsenii]|uniref:DoxX family protein n=1 Tax=Haloferax larsenii TaxID=302484 RepID=A0ABY5RBB6_HALLR|nr:DoxX family protein [Haloferax larsenii]ELZ82241.1 terminal quinol oxidase subunit [Haloferax larsenii JCM 13917]UVE49611.1 DoxX family protein [Haloferax larsenii]
MSVPVQFATPTADIAFLLARVLFGAVIAFMGLNHFMNTDQMAGYAEMKGLPAPRLGVVFSGGMLVFGGLGIAAGVLPGVAAGAIILFLLVSTPMFHNFWAVPEEQQESEMTSFLKNVVMLGGALVFLALSSVSWPYAIGLTVF